MTARPRTILILSAVAILWTASYLPRLTKDTTAEAVIPQDHPSVVYRDKVEEMFGLADPVVIAVASGPPICWKPRTTRPATPAFHFRDVDYSAEVDDDVFTERALRRGI